MNQHFSADSTHHLPCELEVRLAVRPRADVHHGAAQGLVQGEERVGAARDASPRPQRLVEGLPQGERAVLRGVVVVDVQVAAAPQGQVEAGELAQRRQHVVQEAQARVHLCLPGTVQVNGAGDLGLFGVPRDGRRPAPAVGASRPGGAVRQPGPFLGRAPSFAVLPRGGRGQQLQQLRQAALHHLDRTAGHHGRGHLAAVEALAVRGPGDLVAVQSGLGLRQQHADALGAGGDARSHVVRGVPDHQRPRRLSHAEPPQGLGHGEGVRLGRPVLHAHARVEQTRQPVSLQELRAVLARPAGHHGHALAAPAAELLQKGLRHQQRLQLAEARGARHALVQFLKLFCDSFKSDINSFAFAQSLS
mmetsp:Transcript_7691/g.10738  ORF Transcript_7691/g.10738 Transcript_7691/m.10738 type:complete len:361 (+) Transcript_7691:509-1591(+)